jgi:hypothetical protein
MKHLFISVVGCATLLSVPQLTNAQTKSTSKPVVVANCFVSEFKQLALSIHDPVIRTKELMHWLGNNVKTCSLEQLVMINSNRSSWLGTADTTKMSSVIDSLIEMKASNKPELMNQIFGSAEQERSRGGDQTISAGPQGRAPLATDGNASVPTILPVPVVQNYVQTPGGSRGGNSGNVAGRP